MGSLLADRRRLVVGSIEGGQTGHDRGRQEPATSLVPDRFLAWFLVLCRTLWLMCDDGDCMEVCFFSLFVVVEELSGISIGAHQLLFF